MRKLLVVLVLLVALVVAADFAAQAVVTHQAKERLTAQGFTDPDVELGGFPFLPQLLQRRLDHVVVTSPEVRTDDGRAETLTATASDVTRSDSGAAHAASLSARATVTYDEVLRQVGRSGLEIGYAGSGRVRISRTVSLLGQRLSAVATAKVSGSGRTVQLTPTSVGLAGGDSLDPAVSVGLADALTVRYRVQDLPDGLRITRVTARPGGLLVAVAGRSVTLTTG